MCTLTIADFDALDILDADAALVAGEIRESEKRSSNLRHLALVAALHPKSAAAVNRSLNGANAERRSLELKYTKTLNGKAPGVKVL